MKIDWDTHFRLLEHHALTRGGGVVNVRALPGAPTALYAKAIANHLNKLTASKPWFTVQLAPGDYRTHYVTDVVKQIARSCNIGDAPQSTTTLASVQVANDLCAGGNVNIEDVSINVSVADQGLTSLVDAFVPLLECWLQSNYLCLIFQEAHGYTPAQQRDLLHRFWRYGVAELVSVGLLVINICSADAPIDADWPPESDAPIDLTAHFSASEVTTAHRDLAEAAIDAGIYADDTAANAFADALLASSADIREVHVRANTALMNLRELRR